MNIFKRLSNLLFRPTNKLLEKDVVETANSKKIGKVAYFNEVAPQLFGPQLKELGYELNNIENFNYSGILWSTHHFYENDKLNLTVDIQQAPYYTDYGFSRFLLNAKLKDEELLCNVPHELQDEESNFLVIMRDKFFSDPSVISLLKGETWRNVKALGID